MLLAAKARARVSLTVGMVVACVYMTSIGMFAYVSCDGEHLKRMPN